MNQIWNVKDTKLIMNVKLIVKRLKLHKELLPLLSSLVLYAHSFGNILLRITIYSLMNCFASPPCKMVLRSPKCIYGKLHKWFKGYRTCINIKVTNKTKQIMMLPIWSEFKGHAICVLRCICTLFWMHCKMTLCHILKVTSNSSFKVFISSAWLWIVILCYSYANIFLWHLRRNN